jgi:hypothetical protein
LFLSLFLLSCRLPGAGAAGKTKPAKRVPSGSVCVAVCVYILSPVLLSPHRIPPSIAANIPRPHPVALALVLATLSGIGGRVAMIGAAGFGAYISRRCSAVSPVFVGVGSVLTRTFCAARIARVLFALGICLTLFRYVYYCAKRGALYFCGLLACLYRIRPV